MTEKRPEGLFPTKLVAIAAVAGIVAGAAAVYVKQTMSGNAAETADAAQCEGSVSKAAALTPYLKGDVAAMIPVSEPKLIQGLTFQDKEGTPMTMAKPSDSPNRWKFPAPTNPLLHHLATVG